MTTARWAIAAICGLLIGLTATACGSSSGGNTSSGPIKIGASLTTTGDLAEFGINQTAGYEMAVEKVNENGGLDIGGEKRKVDLKIVNNGTDPNVGAEQTRTLILKDEVNALVGPCAPDLVIPQALVADRERIPYVDACVPQRAFAAGNPEGWQYSWANFFDEQEQATNYMKVLSNAPSNKKLAIFTDTEPDGKTERPIYQKEAEAQGLEVVGDYTFPPGTTDFSSFISEAESSGAQLVMAQVIPPDAVALVKQMKSLGFKPQVLAITKGADTIAYPKALGRVSAGTVMDQEYLPGKYPGSAEFSEEMLKKLGDPVSVEFAAFAYGAAQTLFKAMEEAESIEPTAVNEALGELKMTTILGPVEFTTEHINAHPVLFAITQWVGGEKLAYIEPSLKGAKLEVPTAGLR